MSTQERAKTENVPLTQRTDGRARKKCTVLFERSNSFIGSGVGHLSIKSFLHGEAFYQVGANRYRVNDDCYLILNHGQEYTISIDTTQAVESFCLFFAPGFAEEIHYSATTALERLLDEPRHPAASPLYFFEKTYQHDEMLSPLLRRLRAFYPLYRMDSNWLQESAHQVIEQLLAVHNRVQHEVANLSAARAATRAELYRRLHWARDFIAASYNQPLTLDEMAAIACLSPNHFLRTFKALFHCTPHQYLNDQRLACACHLLHHSEQSVTDICLEVGFQSLGSFSWLFRRRIGCSPEQFRQQKR